MTETFVNGDCPSEFTRIPFTATDGCGLTSQHTQTVEVIDVVDPVLNVPSNAVSVVTSAPLSRQPQRQMPAMVRSLS